MASDPSAKVSPAQKADNDQLNGAAKPMQMGAMRGQIYTVTAGQAANAAELINAGMAKKNVGKTIQRRIVVAAPDGPSTQGGKLARQTITLAPVEGAHAIVMCGWLDVAQKAAGLRDYQAVAEQFKARTGKPLDVTAEEYLTIINELEKFMSIIKVDVTHERVNTVEKAAVVAQNIADVEPEQEPPSRTMLTVVGAVILVAAIGMVIALLR